MTPYAWTIAAGALPSGLSLSSAGAISGTPTSAGTYNFTVQVTDANSQTATQALSIVVNSVPVITTTILPGASNGVAYSQTVQTTGGTQPFNWSITTGALPTGLALNASTGVISGTPTANGTYTFTVTVTDANSASASKSLSINVANALTINTNTLPVGNVSDAYSKTVTAVGGVAPYTWSVTSGALPAGLTLSSAGVISGTPTTAGTTSVTIQVTDTNSRTAAKSYTISIIALHVTTAALPNGQVGDAYTKTLAATGGDTPYTWSIVIGNLPAGLTLSSSGNITGTPTVAGFSTSTVQVTDANGVTTTRDLSITITQLHVTTNVVPNGQVGATYTKTLAAAGGATPYTWSVIGGTLPAGLSLSLGGVISGTPTSTAGTPISFTVQVTDANAQTATQAFTATITKTNIVTDVLPNGKVGNAYSKTMAANGGTTPYAWTVVGGALPAGLSLSSAGVISGTPTTAGTTSVTLQATDANGIADSQTYSLKVNP